MSGFDWDRLRKAAAEEYERSGEGRRRREAGSQAAAQAEELAWFAKHRPDTPPVTVSGAVGDDAVMATALAADQSVYVYRDGILLAHLPPSSIFNPVETPKGMRLTTLLMSRSRQTYVRGPEWEPGEWTFAGRGHEGR